MGSDVSRLLPAPAPEVEGGSFLPTPSARFTSETSDFFVDDELLFRPLGIGAVVSCVVDVPEGFLQNVHSNH